MFAPGPQGRALAHRWSASRTRAFCIGRTLTAASPFLARCARSGLSRRHLAAVLRISAVELPPRLHVGQSAHIVEVKRSHARNHLSHRPRRRRDVRSRPRGTALIRSSHYGRCRNTRVALAGVMWSGAPCSPALWLLAPSPLFSSPPAPRSACRWSHPMSQSPTAGLPHR